MTHNRLRNNNTSKLPTGADAVDLSTGTGTAGTANKWKDNEIGTSIPPGLGTSHGGGGHDGDRDGHHDGGHRGDDRD